MTFSGLRKLLVWLGTFTLLGYMAVTTDLPAAWDVIRSADALRFVVAALVMVPVLWLVDALTGWWFLRGLGFRVRASEYVVVRGAGYLLGLVNYGLTLALMSAVVGRRSARGGMASGGAYLLLALVDLGALSLAVLAGLAAFPSPFGVVPTAVVVGFALCALSGAALVSLGARWLSRHPDGLRGRLGRLPILAAFRDVPIGFLARAMPLRLVLILGQVGMNLAFLRAFGFDVGPGEVLVFMPIIGFVAVLPISLAGLGSSQIVARDLFGPFAPVGVAATAAVDAVSTSSILGVMVVRAVLGLACLPFALGAGRKAGSESSPGGA